LPALARHCVGVTSRWGPLFGARAADWAETWEGPTGWGASAYQHVLDRAGIGLGTRLLDCGCGAGSFLSLAVKRGAHVSGIDAAQKLVEIARRRMPDGDLRVGNIEALPWADNAFDVVTGLSSFQFADNHVQALREARRVSRDTVVIVVPARLADSGIPRVLTAVSSLFAEEDLAALRTSGMYALSPAGALEEAMDVAGLRVRDDADVDSSAVLADTETAVRAFLAAGAVGLAVRQSGEKAVTAALRDGIAPFVAADGRVRLAGWYRIVIAH
jgi:SAM-dependent methyltransferase